ncbi:probable serine/threonine-protein kinase At1g54610 [Andrographis paniculata]|uniref:probable serine/threonine-protein kinase At1g54610 n=1 Tax=Andrographis paniculata TaxID=175694 RepID=UPI0021E81D2F|nr:probable serine/threonine-protein kinase At1g54610 [Andrographis paniculata]
MGCVCGKPSSAVKNGEECAKQRELLRRTSELRLAQSISSRRVQSFALKERLENEGVKHDKKVNGSRRVWDDYCDKEVESSEGLSNFPEIRRLPRAVEGEQIAAGWPSWLVAVGGEAIRGWIPRKADTFEKLDKIGQGTYSSVYKGRDLLHNKSVALKKVRFDNLDPESVKFMAREILILRRLDHPNIIKLEGLVTSKTSTSLYLVFEYMEHDLTGLASLPGIKFTEPQVKCYMQQLLSGLDHCHAHGVLHRDIKGSNLLVDDHGILKIADFGLASYFDNNQKVPLTSRVVTLWYRPPELLLGATQYGVAVDLWSAGCILGELYTSKPIMPGRTEVEQLHKIFKLCGSPSEDYWRRSKLPHTPVFKPFQSYRRRISETFKDLPVAAVGLLEILLAIDPLDRGTASSALKSEFFKTKPLACDPSSLPKYPPSKEIDAKLREEEGRRQESKGQKGDNISKRSKQMRAAYAPDAYADLTKSMKSHRKNGYANPKDGHESYNTRKEGMASGILNDSQRITHNLKEMYKDYMHNPPVRISHSGPLAPGVGLDLSGRKYDDISIGSTRSSLYSQPGLVSSRVLSSVESQRKFVSSNAEASNQVGRFSETFRNTMGRQDIGNKSLISGLEKPETGRNNMKEPIVNGHALKERQPHFSGPLLAPSRNIEQVLKEHDRRIQEAARRLRHEKGRGGRIRPT